MSIEPSPLIHPSQGRNNDTVEAQVLLFKEEAQASLNIL